LQRGSNNNFHAIVHLVNHRLTEEARIWQ